MMKSRITNRAENMAPAMTTTTQRRSILNSEAFTPGGINLSAKRSKRVVKFDIPFCKYSGRNIVEFDKLQGDMNLLLHFNKPGRKKIAAFWCFIMALIVIESCKHDHVDLPLDDLSRPAASVGIDSSLRLVGDSLILWLQGMQLDNGLIETSWNSNLVSLYDNALSALVFTQAQDYARAEAIFNYFNNRVASEMLFGSGGFFQFRSAAGQPQGNRWLGDNAWLLIAVNNYEAQTGNNQYYGLKAALTDWIVSQQDTDGGLWGGTDINGNTIGKVTEAMIDAFNAVEGYTSFHEGILQYIELNRWDTEEQLPVSWPGSNYYYALDNFSWGFCAFEGFPERIIDAANRFKTTQLHVNSGDSISGYCFDEDRDAVWMEGSAQMAVAYNKAGSVERVNEILREIAKAVTFEPAIPNSLGLPYASNVGTGYGGDLLWSGSDVKPCTAAATWFIMAVRQFDPLALNYEKQIPANSKFW